MGPPGWQDFAARLRVGVVYSVRGQAHSPPRCTMARAYEVWGCRDVQTGVVMRLLSAELTSCFDSGLVAQVTWPDGIVVDISPLTPGVADRLLILGAYHN